MFVTTAPPRHAYRRPRVTRRGRHDQSTPSAATKTVGAPSPIRRGSFMDHAQQYSELYRAPAASPMVAATPPAAIRHEARPTRTPGTLLLAAARFLTLRRTS